MIKNIVFDMGNVLIYFRPLQYIERLKVNEEDAKLLDENVFKASEWQLLDSGELNEEGVIKSICTRLPENLHGAVRELVCDWYKPLLPVPGMEDLVKNLKDKGYHIYLLSNAGTNQHNYWNDIPGSQYFDGTLVSADVKEVKPNEAIYRILFEKFSLLPEECVFIDDNEKNIRAAKNLNMAGIIFDGDVDKLAVELRKLMEI